MHFLRRATHQPEETDVTFQGIPLTIEWPKGSVREGVNDQGEPWQRKMEAAYGYVDGTRTSGDGEELDVYVGPNPAARDVYAIEQLDEDGERDELKVMLGCDSEPEAVALYRKHYPPDWDNVGEVWPMPVAEFKDLIERRRMKAKKAFTLCVADPDTGRKVLLKDWIEKGEDAEALPKGTESRYLTEDEVRAFARRS